MIVLYVYINVCLERCYVHCTIWVVLLLKAVRLILRKKLLFKCCYKWHLLPF